VRMNEISPPVSKVEMSGMFYMTSVLAVCRLATLVTSPSITKGKILLKSDRRRVAY